MSGLPFTCSGPSPGQKVANFISNSNYSSLKKAFGKHSCKILCAHWLLAITYCLWSVIYWKLRRAIIIDLHTKGVHGSVQFGFNFFKSINRIIRFVNLEQEPKPDKSVNWIFLFGSLVNQNLPPKFYYN